MFPIFRRRNVIASQSHRIQKPNSVGDLVAQHERRSATEISIFSRRYMDNVIDANRTELAEYCVLVVVDIGIGVVRNQMFGLLLLSGNACGDKVRKALCMAFLLEVKIQALPCLLQRNDLRVGVMFQDHLFQVAKCPSVRYFLSHLHHCVEKVRSERPLALLALLVHNCKLDNHGLLQNGRVGNLFLYCEFHPYSHGVLLCPDEGSVNKPNFFAKAANSF